MPWDRITSSKVTRQAGGVTPQGSTIGMYGPGDPAMTTGRSRIRVPIASRMGAAGARVLATGVKSGLQQPMRPALGGSARMRRVHVLLVRDADELGDPE